jgi:RNA polymerase sigma-70 factor (ECF subfamily)
MAWISRIARNQAIDTMRYQHTRVDLELDNGERLLERLVDTSPGQRPDEFDSAVPLLHCLEQLAPVPRSCVVRAFCEGYSHEELSAQTGAPLGTVKSWIRRSLSALRLCLEPFHE